MRKLRLVLPAILAAGLLFIWGVQFATSAPKPAAGLRPAHPYVKTDAAGHGAPVKTYFTEGFSGLTVAAATNTALGAPVSITCPGTAKCKVEIDNTIQLGEGSTAANGWASWETQGTHMSAPGSQYSETTPADGRYETSSEIEEINGVVHGTRLIQPWVYSTGGATVGYYMIVIRVYQP